MQKIIVTGFVGGDPVNSATPSGKKITSFSIGVNTKKGDKKFTSWYKVNCWEDQFSRILPHIKKGSLLTVIGNLNAPTMYTNKQSQDVIVMSMACLSIDFTPVPTPRPVENTSEDLVSNFNNAAIEKRQKDLDAMMETEELGF